MNEREKMLNILLDVLFWGFGLQIIPGLMCGEFFG